MPTFPTGLPALSVGDYAGDYQDTTLRSQTDYGPGKSRPRFTAGAEYITGTYKCTPAQRDTLLNFWKTDLKRGAVSFTWRHPETHATVQARFRKPPTKKPTQGKTAWLISVEIEVLP